MGAFYLISPEGVILVDVEDTADMDAVILATLATNVEACKIYGKPEHVQMVTLVDANGVTVA